MPYAPIIAPSPDQSYVLLRLPEVQRRTGLSRSSIYAKIARGEFPRPVRLGANTVAWPSIEVDAWIADRLAERGLEGGAA